MGWKQNQFERRLRERLAENYAPNRAYISAKELEKYLENDQGHLLTKVWQILSEYWTVGRAMGKSIPEIQDETEKWLKDIGIQHEKVVVRAFVDAQIGHRIWSLKSEGYRMEMANDRLNVSDVDNESAYDEMERWYLDCTIECSDLLNTSPVNANHVLLEWGENGRILEAIWSLYERGSMTEKDRDIVKNIVAEITNEDWQRVEEWICYKESIGQE